MKRKQEMSKRSSKNFFFSLKSRNSESEQNGDGDDKIGVKSTATNVAKIVKKKRCADILPPQKAEFLRNMVIELEHNVLPQHQIESRAGSRVPSAQEKADFIEVARFIKKGSFNKEEDQKIMDNWETFCELHNWSSLNPKPFLFHRHHYQYYLPKAEERKKFVQFLANGLPNRTLYSVYHRFRNLYATHETAKYSFDDDQYILNYIDGNTTIDESRRFADLAKVLNRTRASVWRRYRLLSKKRRQGDEESD